MAGASSTSAVVLALAGNSFLTVTKLAAWMVSGSGAMLSEAIHSFADASNQLLLFIGIRRSARPANTAFPYGFGAERFLFALFSAIGIFLLGCGVSLYHGVHTLLDPPELHYGWLTWAVLGVGLVVDGFVLRKALAVANAERGKRPLLEHLRHSSDPTLAAVLFEDAAACVGILLAALGIGLSQATGSHVPDALATLSIGAMMGVLAVWLGVKNSQLILGRAIPPSAQEAVLEHLRAQPTIERVGGLKSRVLGAGNFRLQVDVDWNGRALGEGLADWVSEQAAARSAELATPAGAREFAGEFGERMTQSLGDEVDRLEADLRTRVPELRHIDLESE